MSDYGFGQDTEDEEWITRLGEDKPTDWIVVTGDKRITKNKAERAAWVKAGLRGFVLAPAFQKTPVHQQAALLLWRWPAMETFILARRRDRCSSYLSVAAVASSRFSEFYRHTALSLRP